LLPGGGDAIGSDSVDCGPGTAHQFLVPPQLPRAESACPSRSLLREHRAVPRTRLRTRSGSFTAIADKLEEPALDLDEAVRLYEEGLRLYAECAKRLDAADLRITQLADALAKQARLPPRRSSFPVTP